jgi:hypothetical protein
MALFEARADLLAAALTLMEIPLCSIYILEQQSDCFFAEGAVARFYWNRHKNFFLAFLSRFVEAIFRASPELTLRAGANY